MLSYKCLERMYKRWNTHGAFVDPKGIRKYLYCPNGVTNDVNFMDSLCILTWWNPFFKSNTEKYFLFCKGSILSSTNSVGKLSRIIILF